jgi:IS5 family transposase
LEKQSLMNILLTAINDQLAELGLYIKAGEVSIIDASVIQTKQCRPLQRKACGTTQDPDTGWNVKKGSDEKLKSAYGYKTHPKGLIKGLAYTAVNVHDSNHFTILLMGNESEVYADSAYQSETHTNIGSLREALKTGSSNAPTVTAL